MVKVASIGRGERKHAQGAVGPEPTPSFRNWRAPETGRYVLVAILVVVKLAYGLWYYAVGINLNLGDTAAYLASESADIFYERSGGIGFAYVATALYSTPLTRILIEVLTVVILCWFIIRMQSNARAWISMGILLLPTSLAFMTVASKELLIFLLVVVIYRMRRILVAPAYLMTVVLKPSFGVIALFPIVRRLSPIPAYFILTAIVVAGAIGIERWSSIYVGFFDEYKGHFIAGNLTYSDAGSFPLTPLARSMGFVSLGDGWVPVAFSACIVISHAILLGVFVRKFGGFVGLAHYAVVIVAIIPYSIFNLGSAARYQAPLICCIILNELLTSRASGRISQVR